MQLSQVKQQEPLYTYLITTKKVKTAAKCSKMKH